MIGPVARGLLLVCASAALLLGTPSESPACQCLDRLWPWNWGRGAAVASSTTYVPPYAGSPAMVAPAVSVSPGTPYATQTCSYVPQTCYRTVVQTVPVTACQAVTCCDPCTGCPVTTYRPVVSYVRSAQLVPYTTYRIVWSGGYAAGCGPCGGVGSTVGAGCNSCAGSSTVVPSYGGAASSPPALTPTPEPPGSSMTTPGLSTPSPLSSPLSRPVGAPAVPPTYEQKKQLVERQPLPPIPEKEETAPPKGQTIPAKDPTVKPGSLESPRLIDSGDRTTALPIRQAGYLEISRSSDPAAAPADDTGWRASRP